MFNWLKKLLGKSKTDKQTDDAIASLYTGTGGNKNRTPLDPDNNPWQS